MMMKNGDADEGYMEWGWGEGWSSMDITWLVSEL